MISVYLSLGSNIGDKKAYLEAALERLNQLPQTSLAAVSSFYETAAWGKTDQDDFLIKNRISCSAIIDRVSTNREEFAPCSL